MPSEKRSFKRFNLFIVVEFRPLGGRAEPFWGITRNFSDKGFSFESQKFSIENGGLLECIFKQPDNQMTVSIPGKIAWKEESDKFQCLTGVKLQDLNEERKAKLLAIMSATGELPSEFFPDDGKTEVAAAIPENNMSKQEEIELSPEEPVSEIGSARLEEPVETAKKSISEEKEGEPERKTPFLIPVTAFIIGVALFVVIKKYDEFFRDLTGFSKKQTIVERVEEQQPQSVDEIPRNDTIMSSEVSIPFDVKAPEEKENVLTRPETYLPDRTDADSGYIPEINTGQPILPEEELINSVKDHVKQAEPDQLVTVPEKESALVSKDLINDMLEIRKFVEINQKQSEEEKIAEATVNKKPANTVELVSEAEVLVKEKEGSSAVTVMSGEADKVQTETPGDEVKKEPENVAEQSVLVKEQKEEDIVLLMEDDKFVPDLPDAETKSITVETLPESKIEPMERVEVPAEAPAEPVDITGILKEKVEGSSIAFILTDTKKEEKVVEEEKLVEEGKVVEEEKVVKVEKLVEEGKVVEEENVVKVEKVVEYEETFDDNANQWDVFNTMVASAEIKDGKYQIENKRRRGLHFVFNEYEFLHDSDFTIEVYIRNERKSKGAYGFALGANDALNNHVILIDNKKFDLIRNRNGVPKKLTSVEIGRDIIKTRSFNRLKIEKNDSNLRLYINDFFILEILNISFDGDKIGFVVGGRSKISVEKMRSQTKSYQ